MNVKTQNNGKLSKNDRQKLIVSELQASPTIRASDLAAELNVSSETIRRDLEELESRGLISRTYGGASRPMTTAPEVAKRDLLYLRQRELIAKEVSGFINHRDIVIIGGGATTSHVARRLAADKHDLIVITDSLVIASILATNTTIRVQICPGTYNAKEGCVCGAETVEYLKNIYANHAILGTSGLTEDGVSNADMDIAATYRTMVHRANEVTVAADHSKIARMALSVYAPWQSITNLVTDQEPCDEELQRALKFAGVRVTIARDVWGGQ